MAKKAVKKVATKKKVVEFYVSKDKFMRAEALVNAGKFKTVRQAYESLDGLIREGSGFASV